MGLFDNVFQKKVCAVCGGEIGLLGNRKLEDGNLCKNCAAKLSPWFSDRRNSTVEEIKQQLAYREENKKAVAAFNATRVIGDRTKIYVDENANKVLFTSASNYKDANPDVLDISQIIGTEIDIMDRKTEVKRRDKDGNMVSYMPARYRFYYDFKCTIRVNHPYFDDISFNLNASSIETTDSNGAPEMHMPNPRFNYEFRKYEDMGNEIVDLFLNAKRQPQPVMEEKEPEVKRPAFCPHCGANVGNNTGNFCEYCGGSLKG